MLDAFVSGYAVICEDSETGLRRSMTIVTCFDDIHRRSVLIIVIVIMGTIASQIASLSIVYSTVYSDADQRKHQSYASLAFVRGILPGTGEFPAQMASNAENVSIWWRHHVLLDLFTVSLQSSFGLKWEAYENNSIQVSVNITCR